MFEHRSDRQQQRRVTASREISAPAGVIFDLLADPSKHPLLDGSGSVLKSRDTAPRRLTLGSRFAMDMRVGVPYRITNTVVELEEGRRIAWRHMSGHRWIWQLDPVGDDRTLVTETFDWSTAHTPGLIEKLGYPERNEKAMVASLERLADLVATEAAPTAGSTAATREEG